MSEAIKTLAGLPVSRTLSTGEVVQVHPTPAFTLFAAVEPFLLDASVPIAHGSTGIRLTLLGPKATPLLELMLGRPAAWVANLDPVDAIALRDACLEVNHDFFTEKLTRALPALLAYLRAKSGGPDTSQAASSASASMPPAPPEPGQTAASG